MEESFPDPHHVPLAERSILALGGHEFSRRRGNEAIRDHLLGLLPGPRPKLCLLPTASGDPADQIAAFRSSFAERECELSHLSLFRLEAEAVDLAEHLLSRDAIYVGGGSMLNLIAIWRAHGVDDLLRRCWERGIVLAGQSAGAMCWFEWGVSRSAGVARAVPGLGFLPGILSAHYHRDPERRQAMLAEVARRGRPGYGLDDGAGILIRGDRAVAALSAREEAAAWRVVPDGRSRAREARMVAEELVGPRPAIDAPAAEVLELRAVRALRAGRS
jgi:peptidase E